MLIYEKTLSRKMIVETPKQNPATQSNGHQNGDVPSNGTSSSGMATGDNSKSNGQPKDETLNEVPTGSNNDKSSTWSKGVKGKLFKQLFGLPSESTHKSTTSASTGQILNLLRADTAAIATRFRETRSFVRIPIGLSIAVWLIWNLLGPSCLFAVVIILIAQGINALLAKLMVRWQRIGKIAKDSRIQKCSQYIDVIRHLRWYAWQEVWLAKVMEARNQELKTRMMKYCLNILSYCVTITSGQLYPIAAFIAYTAFAGHELRIDLIFPALQLFRSLQARLRELPSLITTLTNAYVSMERIEKFAQEPELEQVDRSLTRYSDSHTTSLLLENCSFAWPGHIEPILKNVNMVIQPGLTLIYGKIGSGKSALLQALVGEMDMLHGRLEIPNHTIAYCLQTPWLQSISIRDNILFSAPYAEERYQTVLDACALLPDLATFPEGDLSLIGEK
jgi:ABC-type multidrug transport system fused ATPase/permease subunit